MTGSYRGLKKGDTVIWRKRKGVLLTEPIYKTGEGGYASQWGLWFSDMKWEDGQEQKDFMLCRTDLEIKTV